MNPLFKRYLPANLYSFYSRKQRSFDIAFDDLAYLFRIIFKSYLVIKFLKWFDYPLPVHALTTPYWLDKRVTKHPIAPPFWVPNPNEPAEEKERAKYDELMKKVDYDTGIDFIKHRYLGNDHPMRETSTTVDEYLYDNDTDRILTEMRHNTNLEMLRKKIVSSRNVLSKETPMDDREDMRKALKAKIKPC